MRVLTKTLRLESRGFRYKVALYLSYLYIKLDHEITGKVNPSSIRPDTPVFKVKLASRFGFICSQIWQLLRLVT